MALKGDAKSGERLTFGFENDMRNLVKVYQNTRKSQSWNFDMIILSKLENA